MGINAETASFLVFFGLFWSTLIKFDVCEKKRLDACQCVPRETKYGYKVLILMWGHFVTE